MAKRAEREAKEWNIAKGKRKRKRRLRRLELCETYGGS